MLFNLPEFIGQASLPDLTKIFHQKGTIVLLSDVTLPAFKLQYSRSLGHYEGIVQNTNMTGFGDLFAYFVSVGEPAPSHEMTRNQGIKIPPQGSFISIPPKSTIDIYLSSNQNNCPFLGLYYHRA